jgi:hypothetical protein
MAIDKVTTAAITDSSVTDAKLSFNSNQFRNIIINGDMSIAQRGTSQAAAGSSSGSYQTIDRFKFFNINLGAFTQSQSTDVPTGQGFAKSMKMDCTTADASPAAADALFLSQFVEGQNLQYLKYGTSSAESLTVSFWVKSNKTGTYCFDLRNLDNSKLISKSYTISSADTWEKKTITYAGDTASVFANDNGSSLQCNFWLGAGTDYTSGTLATSWQTYDATDRAVGQVNLADSTSNEWYVTGLQVEAGTSASDFEFLPVDVNKRRCYRYYYRIDFGGGLKYVGYGQVDNDDVNMPAICNVFPEQMRTAPTALEQSGTAGNYKVREALTYECTAVPTFNNASTWNATVTFKRSGITSSNGFAQGELLKCGGIAGYLAWSAEL